MTAPRIVTLTVNPAVDMAADAATVRPMHKTRTFGERYDAGGGGINVARVIKELGGDVVAIFASGGVTGRFVEEMLSEDKVPWESVRIRNPTRISLAVRDQASGLEYRFVPQGPQLDAAECDGILKALEHVEGDWLVASGSLPPGVPSDFYRRVARHAASRGMRVALDTSGAALKASLGPHLDLLKTSLTEFESILGREVQDPADQDKQAIDLVRSGIAGMIALSLGRAGAILATAQEAVRLPAVAITERTGVGAGDSFLGGLILALARGEGHKEALQLAVAAGASAVAGYGTARVGRPEVESIRRRMMATTSGVSLQEATSGNR